MSDIERLYLFKKALKYGQITSLTPMECCEECTDCVAGPACESFVSTTHHGWNMRYEEFLSRVDTRKSIASIERDYPEILI